MSMLHPSQLLPFSSRIRRRLVGAREIEQVADQVIELAPADEAETSEAIALPGEIDRASGTLSTSDLAQQRRWAMPGVLPHGATISYRLDGATLIGNTIYAHGTYRQFGPRDPWLAKLPRLKLGEAQFCGGQGGAHFFGHWLCDDLATELLAHERMLDPIVSRPRWMHDAGYRSLFGLEARALDFARFERLWIVNDHGYNQSRVRRFRQLRERLRAKVGGGGGNRRLYVSRGRTGAQRNLINEEAVVTALAARGFDVIEPEKMAAADLATAFSQASVIVSVEGSALCHGLVAMPSGARMLAIQPPDRVNIFNKIICDFAGLRFGYMVADPHPDGFVADPDRLLRTLDLVEQA